MLSAGRSLPAESGSAASQQSAPLIEVQHSQAAAATSPMRKWASPCLGQIPRLGFVVGIPRGLPGGWETHRAAEHFEEVVILPRRRNCSFDRPEIFPQEGEHRAKGHRSAQCNLKGRSMRGLTAEPSATARQEACITGGPVGSTSTAPLIGFRLDRGPASSASRTRQQPTDVVRRRERLHQPPRREQGLQRPGGPDD